MSLFMFETGGGVWQTDAQNWQDAIKLVWGERPPQDCGLLTSMRENNGEELWFSTERLLELCGHRVEERP